MFVDSTEDILFGSTAAVSRREYEMDPSFFKAHLLRRISEDLAQYVARNTTEINKGPHSVEARLMLVCAPPEEFYRMVEERAQSLYLDMGLPLPALDSKEKDNDSTK